MNLLELTWKKFVKSLQFNLFSRLVDKWSGSIEVGITTHNPSTLEFPATMTNEASGTMMMSGMNLFNLYMLKVGKFVKSLTSELHVTI